MMIWIGRALEFWMIATLAGMYLGGVLLSRRDATSG